MFETCPMCSGQFSKVEDDGLCSRCSKRELDTENVLALCAIDGRPSNDVKQLEISLVKIVLNIRELFEHKVIPPIVDGEKCPYCEQREHKNEMRKAFPCPLHALLKYL